MNNIEEFAKKLVGLSTEDAMDYALEFIYSGEPGFETLPYELEKSGYMVLSLLIKTQISTDLFLVDNCDKVIKRLLLGYFFFLTSIPKELLSGENLDLINDFLEVYGDLFYSFENLSDTIH